MSWTVGTSTDPTWQTGTTSIVPTFGIFQATSYIPGQSCTLQVIGATGTFWVIYSPVNDPNSLLAVLPQITNVSTDVNGDGSVTVTADRGAVRYGESGYMFLYKDDSGGIFSSHLLVPLLPESGKQYVTLADPLALSSEGVWAIPDLVSGDQLVWWNALPSGNVTVNTDRTFVTDGVVESFWVEAHLVGEGYTNTEIQNVNYDGTLSSWTSEPLFYRDSSGTLNLLADITGISYAVREGHSLTGTLITSGTSGTTDASGIFSLSGLAFTAGGPVTCILRWETEGVSRFLVSYTTLIAEA